MRNHSLDSLKLLCASLIIFLHANAPGASCYLHITRCAVPCFFMISGYVLMSEKMEYRMAHSIKRVLWMICWSSFLFAGLGVMEVQ